MEVLGSLLMIEDREPLTITNLRPLVEVQISDGLAFQPQLIIEDLSGKNLWNERINLQC
jgi:hypothetical protein